MSAVDALLEGGKSEALASIIAARINRARGERRRFFRWFDTGDIYRPELIHVIRITAEKSPDTLFWVSTRAWKDERLLKMMREASASQRNLIIRPSADYINDEPPRIEGLAAGVGVFDSVPETCSAHICPGSCSRTGCRACWVAPERPVIYKLH